MGVEGSLPTPTPETDLWMDLALERDALFWVVRAPEQPSKDTGTAPGGDTGTAHGRDTRMTQGEHTRTAQSEDTGTTQSKDSGTAQGEDTRTAPGGDTHTAPLCPRARTPMYRDRRNTRVSGEYMFWGTSQPREICLWTPLLLGRKTALC